LDSRPQSKFGWLNADLRQPLPQTIDELTEAFPIGIADGRRVYLCRIQPDLVDEAHKQMAAFASIEVSKDFSDYYGEKVYICTEP